MALLLGWIRAAPIRMPRVLDSGIETTVIASAQGALTTAAIWPSVCAAKPWAPRVARLLMFQRVRCDGALSTTLGDQMHWSKGRAGAWATESMSGFKEPLHLQAHGLGRMPWNGDPYLILGRRTLTTQAQSFPAGRRRRLVRVF